MDIPQPEFPFRHHTPIQVRFADTDLLGHVNNSIYLQYMDLGKTAYFSDTAPGPVNWRNVNVVVVNINCNFYSPTILGEPIEVLTQTTHIGEKSLRLEQRVINTSTGQVKCAATTIMAGFNPATGQSQPIADEWRHSIAAFEQRTV